MKFNQCTSILRASHPPCETTLRCDANGNPVDEIHTFIWDGDNIVLERIAFADGTTLTCEYFWGPDKSGTEQGAGGVEGLLAVAIDGVFYIPCYDHNGNIVLYVSEAGNIAARYTYDPYGNVIEQGGDLADAFAFGFSTKYRDHETGLVAYQRRFYSPGLSAAGSTAIQLEQQLRDGRGLAPGGVEAVLPGRDAECRAERVGEV